MNLQTLHKKTILLLGKSRAFTLEEFTQQMQAQEIELSTQMQEGVEYIIEGRMMTPYEQNTLDGLYEMKKYTFLRIDAIEVALAKSIDADVLLMSLKLSHDRERLKSFLQNSALSDELFLRLLSMYQWGDEDFFESDANRDISAAFILRFYEQIERNHNVQYATTGFLHLIRETERSEVLEAIASLKPLALHPNMQEAIAQSGALSLAMQKRLYAQAEERILEALSYNKNLDISLVKEYKKEAHYMQNIAKNILLNSELFALLVESETLALALNESLTPSMQEEIYQRGKKELYYALALNDALDSSLVERLFSRDDRELEMALLANAATPKEILIEAYKEESNHEALAQNENTPIEILYQLQLDSRYERFVKTNAAFGRHIQSENIGWL